jgi:uncharacterized protein DUF4399
MFKHCGLIAVFGVLAACSREEPTPPAAPAAAPPPATSTVAAPAPSAPALARKPAPAGATAYIIEPVDGATVGNPVRVVFGLKGIGVAPAGTDRADAGHHHLLIDAEMPPLDIPIPNDAQHMHFGAGQTETEVTLAPGRHELRLLLGDNLHVPFDPPIVSAPITIEVR